MLPFLLLACAPAEIAPEAGVYLFAEVNGTATCEGDTFGTESLRVGVVEDPPAVVILDVELPLDGLAFAGELWSTSEDYNELYGADAIVTDAGSIEGAWASDTVIEGSYYASISCFGSDCDRVDTLCETIRSFTLETPTE